MNNILNYIKSGQGIGAKYLLIYALLFTIIIGVSFKSLGNMAVPSLQNAADQLLPIKIENGVIVEPANTVKSINLGIKGAVFPFILDTTVDSIDTSRLKDGIYITRKAVYVVGKRQTKVYSYEDSLTLNKDDYTDFFKEVISWTVWFISFAVFIFLYVMYLALASFYALFAILFAKIFKSPLDYCGGMRLSALAYIATSAVLNLLKFAGFESSVWTTFFSVLILQILAIKTLSFTPAPTKKANRI